VGIEKGDREPGNMNHWYLAICRGLEKALPFSRYLPRARRKRLIESLIGKILFLVAISAIVSVFFIILFLLRDGYQIFFEIGPVNFLAGQTWNPTGVLPLFGAFPLIMGTLLVMVLAMIISIPLSIGSAIFIAEIASPRLKAVIKPAIELLAGIPSVVYGFFGLILLTDWIQVVFNQPSGSSWLAGSILLSIMALPTITSVAEDAISAVPREFKEGSLAIGANHWQTIREVILPGALSGITAAIILGMGRAIGETMAVLMVTGNAAIIPDPITNVFSPIRTLTGTLGIEMGEVATGSLHFHALFGLAVILLVITLIVNILASFIINRIKRTQIASQEQIRRKDEVKLKIFEQLTFDSIIARPLSKIKNSLPVRELSLVGVRLFRFVHYKLFLGIFQFIGGDSTGYFIRQLRKRLFKPKSVQKFTFLLITLSVVIVLFVLGLILYEIVTNGIGALSWEFLTEPPQDLGRSGGIFPAIVGTLYLVGGALIFACPIGIASAIYLTEYTKESRVTHAIGAGVDLLNGTPSIVFGLFGFAFLVLFLNFGISMIAGQVTLGLMILPTIIRTTEESLRAVPKSLQEGSFALGASKWQTVWRVVLPPAMPGIITGTILSIGRAAGETAPIMFTAVVFSSRFLPSSVFQPVMALPYHLYILTTSVPGASENKFGTALVILIIVLSIYFIAIMIRRRYQWAKVM
jgi:phosphate transport system permease protein